MWSGHPRFDFTRQRTRIHFIPQHWLLCNTGLYQLEFEFALLEGLATNNFTGAVLANLIIQRTERLQKVVGTSWRDIGQASLEACLRSPLHGDLPKVAELRKAGKTLPGSFAFCLCVSFINLCALSSNRICIFFQGRTRSASGERAPALQLARMI